MESSNSSESDSDGEEELDWTYSLNGYDLQGENKGKTPQPSQRWHQQQDRSTPPTQWLINANQGRTWPQPSQLQQQQVQQQEQQATSTVPTQRPISANEAKRVILFVQKIKEDFEEIKKHNTKLKEELQLLKAKSLETDQVSKSVQMISKYFAEMKKGNEKLKEENEKLKEKVRQLMQQGENFEKFMESVQTELQRQQNSGTESTIGSKRIKEKQRVDPQCRDTFRKMYKRLEKKSNFQGFDFEESFQSVNNQEVLKRVKEKMCGNKKRNRPTKWTDEEIKNAGQRYFVSLRETNKKKKESKYHEHKAKCRRLNRKKEKSMKRTQALNTIRWDKTKKGKVAEVLTEEYMSSEVSVSEEEAQSSSEVNPRVLRIKTLSWESDMLKEYKKNLDEASRQRSRRRPLHYERERRFDDVSSRPKPKDGPSWAFREHDE